jgi:hypothetical protein
MLVKLKTLKSVEVTIWLISQSVLKKLRATLKVAPPYFAAAGTFSIFALISRKLSTFSCVIWS